MVKYKIYLFLIYSHKMIILNYIKKDSERDSTKLKKRERRKQGVYTKIQSRHKN